MAGFRATRWRVLQLLGFLLVGVGLILAQEYASIDAIDAGEPLLFALGALFVAYAVLAAVYEVGLAVHEIVGDRASED